MLDKDREMVCVNDSLPDEGNPTLTLFHVLWVE